MPNEALEVPGEDTEDLTEQMALMAYDSATKDEVHRAIKLSKRLKNDETRVFVGNLILFGRRYYQKGMLTERQTWQGGQVDGLNDWGEF